MKLKYIVVIQLSIFLSACAASTATKRPSDPSYKVNSKVQSPDVEEGTRCFLLENDYDCAVSHFLPIAKKGDAKAQHLLGDIHRHKYLLDGKYLDYPEALKWYEMSADLGNLDSVNALGIMYVQGVGVEQDSAKALDLFQSTAEQGHPTGQFWMGKLYEQGLGVKKNDTEALKWYRLSADQDSKVATKALLDLEERLSIESARGIERKNKRAQEKARRQAEEEKAYAAEQAKIEAVKASLTGPQSIGKQVCKNGELTFFVTHQILGPVPYKTPGMHIARIENHSGDGNSMQLRSVGWGEVRGTEAPMIPNGPPFFGPNNTLAGSVFWDEVMSGWYECSQ